MKAEQFENIINNRIETCKSVLCSKAEEYATDDRLHNFKVAGELDLPMRKLRAYVLTNFNTTFAEDLFRIYALRDIGVDPYVMIYDKDNAPKQIRHLQRWCNNKRIFRTEDCFFNYKY